MTDQRDHLDGPNDGPSLPSGVPLLRLNQPLVAAVDMAPSLHDSGESSEAPAPAPFMVEAFSSIDAELDRHLHGEHELLGPAELRRAALLRLIGLGRFANRPQPN